MKNKLFVLVCIGFLTSIVCHIFSVCLDMVIDISFDIFPYNLVIIPIFFYIYNKYLLTSHIMKSPTKKIFYNEMLDKFILLYQLPLVLLSHLSGASVGREGVGILISANIVQWFKKRLKFTTQQANQLAIGTGFASLFATPLSGFFFSVDHMKKKDYKVIASLSVSIISTVIMNKFLGHESMYFEINYFKISPKYILIALLCYMIGKFFVTVSLFSKKNSTLLGKWTLLFVLVVIMYISNGRYQSLGLNLIQDSFNSSIYFYDFVIKLMVTIGFISLGFQGGEVTPLFSIGACLGAFLSIIFNLDTPACIAIGFVSVFVGATNGYLCGIILCIELFNYKIAIVIASLLLLKNISQFKKSIYT